MTIRKLNGLMVAAGAGLALSVFLLLALVSYERVHYEHPEAFGDLPNLLYWASKVQYVNLGGAAYFLVACLAAWSVIVFFRERNGEILLRAGGTALLQIPVAIIPTVSETRSQ